MARVLAISSQVARGHVGLSAIVPALQCLGHEAVALPTVLLSNHPGHGHAAGTAISVSDLRQMLDALEGHGWLADIDAILTGYLPSVPHVLLAGEAIERVRAVRPELLVVCDPVLGDDPKGLYIAEAAARAIANRLLPAARFATPNRFELAWLSECQVTSIAEAVAAARALPAPSVLATSIPTVERQLGNVLVEAGGALLCRVEDRAAAPHGTGDLMAALFLGHLLSGQGEHEALALAVAGVEAAIDASAGSDELVLVAAPETWVCPKPQTVESL